jgi:hypothetical protein
MHSRKVAAARPPANRFSVFAESDSDEEDAVVVPVIEVAEQPIVPAPNRFEGLVATPQKGRWSRQRIEPEESWIRLRPSPEHEQAAIAASGIDQSVLITGRDDPVRDVPRTAHDWAEKVKQSLEKAESAPRVERLKDIHESLNRLSFFRRPCTVVPAPAPAAAAAAALMTV